MRLIIEYVIAVFPMTHTLLLCNVAVFDYGMIRYQRSTAHSPDSMTSVLMLLLES